MIVRIGTHPIQRNVASVISDNDLNSRDSVTLLYNDGFRYVVHRRKVALLVCATEADLQDVLRDERMRVPQPMDEVRRG